MLNTILIFGVISSLIFYETTEISPGGIITPIFLSIYINNPEKIVITFVLAILTFLLVEFLSNLIIIYGRRKFAVYILTSLLLKIIFEKLGFVILENFEIIIPTTAIGIIIPALIARDIEKQGYIKTITATLIVSIFIKVGVELINSLGDLL